MDLVEVFVGEYGVDPTYQLARDIFYAVFGVMAFEMQVFLGVWMFAVNISDDLDC